MKFELNNILYKRAWVCAPSSVIIEPELQCVLLFLC